jgi:hypothetical protein
LCGNLGYSFQTVDVSAFADGGNHTIEFHSEIFASNGGGSNFFVDDVVLDVVENPSPCDLPSDVPWLSVSPDTGTTAPGSTTPVDVTTDATGLVPGLYTANLCVSSNDPVEPLVTLPVTMTVVVAGVDISPPMASMTGEPGAMVTYTLQVENLGEVVDTYDITAGGNTWTVDVLDPVVTLLPDEVADIEVVVHVPSDASDGDTDMASVSATSQDYPSAIDSSELTTEAVIDEYVINLPIVFK